MRPSFLVLFLAALSAIVGAASAVPQSVRPDQVPSANGEVSCIPAWMPFGGMDDIESSISSAAVGSDGFLYLGGVTGLHRIEGKRVRTWLPDPNDPNSLASGTITALVSQDDSIWIGSSTGLSRFDRDAGTFERIPITSDFPADPRVLSLFVDQGSLYVGTIGANVAKVDLEDPSKVVQIELERAETDPAIFDFARFDGKVVIATREGLEVISKDLTTRSLGAIAPRGAEALVVGHDEALWVGADDGLYRIAGLSPLEFERFDHNDYPALPSGPIEALALDEDNRLWIGGEAGLARWSPGEPAPINCRRDRFENLDRRVSITTLSTEMPGLLIMGTRGSQAKIARLNTGVRRIATGNESFSNLPRTAIWSTLITSRGQLLLGTSQGLFRETAKGADQFEKLYTAELNGRRITSLYEAEDKELWIGTSRGLFVASPSGLDPVPLIINNSGEQGQEIIYKIVPHEKHLLLASPDGLITLDRAKREVLRLVHSDEREKAVNDAPATQLERAGFWHASVTKDYAFATGSTYIYRFDAKTGQVLSSTDQARASGSFAPGRTLATIATDQGSVLIGTDNGLVITDLEFQEFEFVDRLQGKHIGIVRNLIAGPDGTIWMSSGELGLLRFEPGPRKWSSYSVEDGLHVAVTTQGALSVSGNGTVVSATGIGATVIPPGIEPLQKRTTKTLIAYNSKDQLAVPAGSTITLDPGDRQLSFDFAVPELLEKDRYWVQYSFTLGTNTEASKIIDLDRPLNLQYLQPGRYAFSGQIVSASGPVSEPLEFEILVLAHWWERQSTYLILGLTLVGLLAAAFVYRTRSIERKFQIIADERRRIAQELHDSSLQDLFGAQMLGRSLKVDGSQAGAEGQKDQVLGLLKSATSSMRESVMSLSEDPQMPTLSKAIGEFEPPAALSRKIDINYQEEGKKWMVGKHRRFFVARIAQEAINNAAKHAKASRISTKIDWSFWNLTLEVADNGEGFDPASPDYLAGHGREAMQCMADAVSGKLETVSAPGEGTRIRLRVPRFTL